MKKLPFRRSKKRLAWYKQALELYEKKLDDTPSGHVVVGEGAFGFGACFLIRQKVWTTEEAIQLRTKYPYNTYRAMFEIEYFLETSKTSVGMYAGEPGELQSRVDMLEEIISWYKK
jgi:hypothetical protein